MTIYYIGCVLFVPYVITQNVLIITVTERKQNPHFKRTIILPGPLYFYTTNDFPCPDM